MIRLIIVLVFLFLLWLLFVSQFSQPRKIVISIVAVLMCVFGIWYDDYSKKAVDGVVEIQNVKLCGVAGAHSYRTNYDIELCLHNQGNSGTIKRIQLAIQASRCNSENMCVVVDQVERSRSLEIAPGEQIKITENLNFPKLDASQESIQWDAQVLSVKAVQ